MVKKIKVKSKNIKGTSDNDAGGGVSLQKVNIKNVKDKKNNEEKRKASRNGLKYFKSPQGKRFLWIIPPTSANMKGMPYVERIFHRNLGPTGNGFIPCVRKELNRESTNECPACTRVNELWNKHRANKESKPKLAEKYKKEAMDLGAKARPLLQILDVSGCYDKKGKVVDEFPKCFGENLNSDDEKYPKCRTCPFSDSCKAGVQLWDQQYGPYNAMMEKITEDEVDITNPEEVLPMRLGRKGEGKMGTEYTVEWPGNTIKIPQHVLKFVVKNAIDLTTQVKPSNPDDVIKAMDGDVGPSESSDDSHKPNKGDKKKNFSSSKEVSKPRISAEQKAAMIEKLKNANKKKSKK